MSDELNVQFILDDPALVKKIQYLAIDYTDVLRPTLSEKRKKIGASTLARALIIQVLEKNKAKELMEGFDANRYYFENGDSDEKAVSKK